jgi:hypothetical protein
VKKMDKVDGTDADNSEWNQGGVSHGSRHPASKYSRQFAIFKDGCRVPEDWIKRMFWTLLKVQAFSYFEHHLMRRLETEDSEAPDNELIELVLRDVGLEYIPEHAIRI